MAPALRGAALTINEYAIPALQWACGSNIMQGSSNNLMPFGNATCAQVATIFQRFCQNEPNKRGMRTKIWTLKVYILKNTFEVKRGLRHYNRNPR